MTDIRNIRLPSAYSGNVEDKTTHENIDQIVHLLHLPEVLLCFPLLSLQYPSSRREVQSKVGPYSPESSVKLL